MFHAVALVVSLFISLPQQAAYSDDDGDNSHRIERLFQPMTECDLLSGQALRICIERMQQRGMDECRAYLGRRGIREGVWLGPRRYDCLIISMD